MRALPAIALLAACTGGDSVAPDAEYVGPFWDAWTCGAGVLPCSPFSCDLPLPCPAAGTNRVTVCGRLRDLETDAPIQLARARLQDCDLEAPSASGACQLQLRFHDMLALAVDPDGAARLTPENFRLDDCGRFVAENLPRPATGYLALRVDDATGTADDHRVTARGLRTSSGVSTPDVSAYALRATTDAAWTAQLGLGAPTVADRGATLALFADPDGVPVANLDADADAYFSDADPLARTTIAPAGTATGADGAALYLDASLIAGSADDCLRSNDLAGPAPGAVFVTARTAWCP